MRISTLLLTLALAACAPKRSPEADYQDPRSALEIQRERAAKEGHDQTLQLARLASMAIAAGEADLADKTLRRIVAEMQDFRADGQFRATVGVESAKEWKGDPYEKMMAFLYLGQILYEQGQYGNALAMSKSAILADTGTSLERYRSDFIAAFVLQSLSFAALGEENNAERSMAQAVDALWMRALTDHLGALLAKCKIGEAKRIEDVEAAKILLLAGLPAGLSAHPRDPQLAIAGALSYASDLRKLTLQSKRKDWPMSVGSLSRGAVDRSFDHLEPLARKWQEKAAKQLPQATLDSLQADEDFLVGLLEDAPGLLLWVETGRGPRKVATGRYNHILQIQPREVGHMPSVVFDGHPLPTHFVDSVTFQAQTRGGRAVDGFLKGKAVFKDSATIAGWVLLEAGDVAAASDDDTMAAILYAVGAVTFIAGIATNPRADTRTWELLPDALWMVRADPAPGAHKLRIDGRSYTVQIPDDGTVTHLIPQLPPGGLTELGEPCVRCEVPLAIPTGGPQ